MEIIRTTRILLLATAAAAAISCGNTPGAAKQEEAPMPEGVTLREIDSLTLMTIRDDDGEKRMPNELFYGEADSAKVESLSPDGSVASSISCFVVGTQGKRILFDTGNGPARGGRMTERLKAAGIDPGQIDLIMVTHFHGDHIGGMAQEGKPLFPNAEVYVPESEYAAWAAMGDQGAKTAMEAMQAYEGHLHRFNAGDTLPLGVTAMAAPGHTPGHTVYQIGRIFIAGDLIHGFDLQIQDLDICPSFDTDRKLATESRKRYIDYIRQNKLITAGMHFPGNGIKESL